VTIQQSGSKGVIMKIEGKIAGPKVSALNESWQDLAPFLGQRKLLVDLRGVTHIDGTGRNLLADIHSKAGAAFLADTPHTKYFEEEAQRGVRTRSHS
jgi:anti-anti-sigma regulatory factor